MKIPAKVMAVVNASQIDSSLHFVETVSMLRGEPCLRLYAYKHTKTRGKECKEVGRRFIDRDMVTGSLYWTRLGGYQVVFKKSKRIGYYTLDADDRFYELTEKTDFRYPERYYNRLYTSEDVLQAFKGADEWLDYLFVPPLDDIPDTMDFLRCYREHSGLEMLAKTGFGYLYVYKNLWRMSFETNKKFKRWLKFNRDYVLEKKPNLGWILNAVKLDISATEYQFTCMVEDLTNRLEPYHYELGLIKEMCHYILKQTVDVDIYHDYIRVCEKLGSDIKARGVLFPKQLMERHDEVVKLISEKENKETNAGLMKAFEILKQYIENTGEFQLVIPKCQNDLVRWGNELHCCVGSMDYGSKMAKGETIILGVFLNNKIIECCEIKFGYDKKFGIVQLRGDHNQNSPYHNEAQQTVNQFLMNYKPQNLMGSCI